jgi:hypothetical protein
MKVNSWKPDLIPAGDMLDNWVSKQLEDLAATGPWADGRVQLGLGFDGLFLPKDVVVDLYDRARKAGVKVITTHYVRGYFGKLGRFKSPDLEGLTEQKLVDHLLIFLTTTVFLDQIFCFLMLLTSRPPRLTSS